MKSRYTPLAVIVLTLVGCAGGAPLPQPQGPLAFRAAAALHVGDVVTRKGRGGYAQLAWDSDHGILLGLQATGSGGFIELILGRKPAFALPSYSVSSLTYSVHDRAFYFVSGHTLYRASAEDRTIQTVTSEFHGGGPLAADDAGNIYGVDGARFVKIHGRKITPISKPGSLPKDPYGAPIPLAFDSKNRSLYFTDSYANEVKRVLPNGRIAVVAGHCEHVYQGYRKCYPGDIPGRGNHALFGTLSGIAYDPLHDRLIVADSRNNRLWAVNPNGLATPIAGYGPAGTVDGNGWHAFFYTPSVLTYAPNLHAMFFSDGRRVGTYALTGTRPPHSVPPTQRFALSNSTLSLSSPAITGSSIWFAMSGKLYNFTPRGGLKKVVTNGIAIDGPIVADAQNNLWIAYSIAFPDPTSGILRIDAAGEQTRFSVPNAHGALIQSLIVGPDGNPWFCIADPLSVAIGSIVNGVVTTYTVPWRPSSVVAGPDGNIWYGTDSVGIGRMTTAGQSLSPIFVNASIWKMAAKAGTGDVWFLDSTGYNAYRVYSGNKVQAFSLGSEAGDITVTPNDEAWIAGGLGILSLRSSGKMTGYYLPSSAPAVSGIAAGANNAIWGTSNAGQIFLMNPAAYATSGLPYDRDIAR